MSCQIVNSCRQKSDLDLRAPGIRIRTPVACNNLGLLQGRNRHLFSAGSRFPVFLPSKVTYTHSLREEVLCLLRRTSSHPSHGSHPKSIETQFLPQNGRNGQNRNLLTTPHPPSESLASGNLPQVTRTPIPIFQKGEQTRRPMSSGTLIQRSVLLWDLCPLEADTACPDESRRLAEAFSCVTGQTSDVPSG